MIFKRLKNLLATQFSVVPDNITEESLLIEDLGLDLVELAMALEDVFELDEVDDLSNLTTIEELVDFLQMELDM